MPDEHNSTENNGSKPENAAETIPILSADPGPIEVDVLLKDIQQTCDSVEEINFHMYGATSDDPD